MAPRTRDAGLDVKILAVARELLESGSPDGFGVEEVARRAGVAKSTVYRRWPSRDALLLAILKDFIGEAIEVPDTGDVRSDLTELVSQQIDAYARGPGLSLVQAAFTLATSVQRGGEAGEELRRLAHERRAQYRKVLERAQRRGEIRAGVSIDAALDAAFGALWGVVFSLDEPAPDLAARVVAVVLDGIAA